MPHPRLATFRLLAAAVLLGILAGCQTTAGGSGPASEARAERLVRQGNHAEAARMYEDLANANPPPVRDELALSATRAWLEANRADDAQRALGLTSESLPAAPAFERDLLRAEVGVARGQYQSAWQQISRVAEPARPQDAARLFQLRQQVALRAGQTGDAVRAGIARERVATDEAGRTRARRDLLGDLRSAIDRGLRVDPAASRDALERGWIEIAQIASTAGRSPMSVNGPIERWRQRFPGHPASTLITSDILDPAGRGDAAGSRNAPIAGPVALLLPLSDRGGTGNAAALVRDGFQAAVARLPDAGRFELKLYDTAAQPVNSALQQAVSEGATFIVGPLTKEEVQAAASQRPADVPMLLLNTLPGTSSSASSWQYALAPEDEARQIARQIAGSGGRNVVVLTPTGDWGQRVSAAFAEELRAAGGSVMAEGQYSGISENIDGTVRRTLGIDASRERQRQLQTLVGRPLQFEVRPMPGVDAIFAAGYQSQSLRQINSWLRFYNAGGIPTYITSDGLGEDRTANRDLDGMRLVEMPWVLDTVGTAFDVRLATENSWSSRGGPRNSRLFAFGYDAAMLAANLRRTMVNWPIDGVTGRLNLTPDGRIERSLNWARVQDGTIQPADPQAP